MHSNISNGKQTNKEYERSAASYQFGRKLDEITIEVHTLDVDTTDNERNKQSSLVAMPKRRHERMKQDTFSQLKLHKFQWISLTRSRILDEKTAYYVVCSKHRKNADQWVKHFPSDVTLKNLASANAPSWIHRYLLPRLVIHFSRLRALHKLCIVHYNKQSRQFARHDGKNFAKVGCLLSRLLVTCWRSLLASTRGQMSTCPSCKRWLVSTPCLVPPRIRIRQTMKMNLLWTCPCDRNSADSKQRLIIACEAHPRFPLVNEQKPRLARPNEFATAAALTMRSHKGTV